MPKGTAAKGGVRVTNTRPCTRPGLGYCEAGTEFWYDGDEGSMPSWMVPAPEPEDEDEDEEKPKRKASRKKSTAKE